MDILVNAAGNTDRGTILDTDEGIYDAGLRHQCQSTVLPDAESLEIMVRDKIKGAVANIISMSAHGGQSFLAAYCAAKGALVTLTRIPGSR